MYKRKLHKEISSGLLVLIVAFSLTGCGSSRDALEISDTESAQAEEVGQETAPATPATSQTTPETTTEPEPEKLTYQTGLYQEKTLADQVSVDAARELPEGEYGVLSYSYDETVSVWGNGAEDCLVIHDGDREYKVDVLWQNMYSAPPAVEAADYDGDGDKEYYISTIQGTGTGVYVEGLYYVDVQKEHRRYLNIHKWSRILTAGFLRRSWMRSSTHFMWIFWIKWGDRCSGKY